MKTAKAATAEQVDETTAPDSSTTTYPSEVLRIPVGEIVESPSNPRKTFHDLDELAEDLKRHGMLQPLLVRRDEGAGFYELVFGARRFRAAKIAKLETVPAMVRELSDEKVLELQIVENSQRSDVHPLEEAEGFETLHTKYGMSVEDIAAKVGRAKAHVYARMKLLELVPEARKAFYAGELTPSTALYLARIPAPIQKRALADLTRKDYKGDLPSAREAFSIIAQRYHLKLEEAPFDRGDATLVPKAGSCKDCPKRTGNQRELFADVKSGDVCTDPECFADKVNAHKAAERARLEAKGVRVVAAKVQSAGGHKWTTTPDGFVKLDDYCPEANNSYAKALKKGKVKRDRVVMLDDKGRAVELVERKALPALLKAAGVHQRKDTYGSKLKSDQDAHAKKEKAERPAREAAEDRAIPLVLAAIKKSGSSDALWRIAGKAIYADERKLPKLKGGALVAFIFDEILTDTSWLEDVCKAVKVDYAKIAKLIACELIERPRANHYRAAAELLS